MKKTRILAHHLFSHLVKLVEISVLSEKRWTGETMRRRRYSRHVSASHCLSRVYISCTTPEWRRRCNTSTIHIRVYVNARRAEEEEPRDRATDWSIMTDTELLSRAYVHARARAVCVVCVCERVRVYDSIASLPRAMHRGSTCAPQSSRHI